MVSTKKLNKAKTIMYTAKLEVHKPEDELLQHICDEIAVKLPKELVNLEEVMVLFPVVRENSMNTVLTQELIRFNRLHSKILTTLAELKAAQLGQILMTEQLSLTRLQLI